MPGAPLGSGLVLALDVVASVEISHIRRVVFGLAFDNFSPAGVCQFAEYE